ncbi:hypothetical protein ABID94_003237 [Streptomyces sp. PvR018]
MAPTASTAQVAYRGAAPSTSLLPDPSGMLADCYRAAVAVTVETVDAGDVDRLFDTTAAVIKERAV